MQIPTEHTMSLRQRAEQLLTAPALEDEEWLVMDTPARVQARLARVT